MIAPPDRGIYLASRSPRRRELLTQIGVRYHLLLFRDRPEAGAEVNEDPLPNEAADAYVERVARAKAQIGWKRMVQRNLPQAPVLAADTTVVVDGKIFGKPVDRPDAERMLAALSGRGHEVLTSIALQYGDQLDSVLSRSEVRFKALTADEIRDYVASGEADDKAGAYAIQGLASRFVTKIRGSYSNVVGLPISLVYELICQLGTAPNDPCI
jgi:septum formation protein